MKTKKTKKENKVQKTKKEVAPKDLDNVTGGGKVGGFAISGRSPS